jgi:AP-3 complex subunit delta-1
MTSLSQSSCTLKTPDSELAQPQKLLPYLLHSDISQLAPETIAVYLLSAAKIFSYWAADLAERWDDDLLQDVKDTVDSVMEGLQPFVSSNHSEVQERVRATPGSVQQSAKT